MQTFTNASAQSTEKSLGAVTPPPKAEFWELPAEGFVRLKQILAPHGPIPVSRSTWWAGVANGRFPKPNKFFGSSITAWDVADIRRLIAQATAKALND